MFVGQHVQNRQSETCRLAGAGLGADDDVVTIQDNRDGLCLYRRGLGVTGIGDSADELGSQAEGFK